MDVEMLRKGAVLGVGFGLVLVWAYRSNRMVPAGIDDSGYAVYGKRQRRVLPALWAMLATFLSLVLVAAVLGPQQLEILRGSVTPIRVLGNYLALPTLLTLVTTPEQNENFSAPTIVLLAVMAGSAAAVECIWE